MEKTSGTAGIRILVDHDIEGKARLLYQTLRDEGWSELCSVSIFLFPDVGLPDNSTDKAVAVCSEKQHDPAYRKPQHGK